MQAVVKFDTYELADFQKLKRELVNFSVFPFTSELPNIKGPFLYYETPYTRIAEPEKMFNLLNDNNFDKLLSNHPDISFDVMCGEEIRTIGYKSTNVFTNGVTGNVFRCKDRLTYLAENKPLPILLVAHNRPLYLELTINSLVFSMGKYQSDIHLLMSAPTNEVKNVCRKLSDKYKNITLYHSDENVGFSGINMLNQILNPDKFIIWEDDYILPLATKFSFPLWNIKFGERLEYLDLVSFIVSRDNYFSPIRDNPEMPKHVWVGQNAYVAVIGAICAITSAKYRKLIKKSPNKWFTALDSGMMSLPRSNFTISGYHIGCNQEMDGFIANKFTDRFPIPQNKQKIVNMSTGEIHVVYLDAILKM